MDLLDSIMSKMTKPPSINDKQKKLMREQQQAFDEARNKEREQLAKFRQEIEKLIHTFIQDPNSEKIRLEPMDQVCRSVVRDVADVAGLTSYTFGVEGEDRHIMLFKKDYPLDERELAAYRTGRDWSLQEANIEDARLAEERRQSDFRDRLLEQQRRQKQQLRPTAAGPLFVDKIDRLVGGRQTGKEAAINVNADDDRQFGFVRCEQKKDKRTIEETLADIRAAKKKKTAAATDTSSSATDDTKDSNASVSNEPSTEAAVTK